jgi:hypothetical protein
MSNLTNVSEIVFTTKGLPVTDELLRLAHMVEAACACKTQVSFSFDHALRIAVDVRTFEDVHIVESILPQLAGGVFQNIMRSATPHHAFLKRVTATVDR